MGEHLASLNFERHGQVVSDPWLELVQPKMKEIVYQSLAAVQDIVQPRSNSFQLFGYDFMISDDMNAWIIEVNSSPDLSYSTSVTRDLVKAVLDDMMKVIIDAEKFGTKLERPKHK